VQHQVTAHVELVAGVAHDPHEVENQYARAVRRSGNTAAQEAIRRVFRVTDRAWRGIGPIPASGLALAGRYARYDAERRFEVGGLTAAEHPDCVAGEILTGVKVPTDCVAFGVTCTPRTPLGAPMVSTEGTCAAYWTARRRVWARCRGRRPHASCWGTAPAAGSPPS
jgi:hydrogenase expression/formation protein HypD